MNKKEAKAKVDALLGAGVGKTAVYQLLRGKGVRDSVLAYCIASHVDAAQVDEHAAKIDRLLWIMYASSLLGVWTGWGLAATFGPLGKGVILLLCAGLPLFFAWGFYKNLVGFYNAFLVLQVVQLPKVFNDFNAQPVTTLVVAAINVAVLAYVAYVRHKLFPDFVTLSPKKLSGRYVFMT
ncbi:hypothetical protein [uncultured Rhodoferax sp.]|uniref:hypothetical protein n=1 Tax=uncultured Rhodoferax sp. TaxID=223188 RepID=UPI0025E1E7F0|nr:hypothetical protein [uncultured Rhodoferax sp.]